MVELYYKKLNFSAYVEQIPEIMKWSGMPLEIVMHKRSACCSVYAK
jgi:hypothetical protein